MANPLDCKPCREGTHSKFISTENKCTHIGHNQHRKYVQQYQVDGSVISKNSTEPRCDYLLLVEEEASHEESAYYIELKGSDIEKAIAQIANTEKILQSALRSYVTYRRIVYRTGSHDVHSQKVKRWQLDKRNKLGSRVLEDHL